MQRLGKFARAEAAKGLKVGSQPTITVGNRCVGCNLSPAVGRIKRSPLRARLTDCTGPRSFVARAPTGTPSSGGTTPIAIANRPAVNKYNATRRIVVLRRRKARSERPARDADATADGDIGSRLLLATVGRLHQVALRALTSSKSAQRLVTAHDRNRPAIDWARAHNLNPVYLY